jgi:serine/threonine protein kinase
MSESANSTTPPETPLVGAILGRYELVREIGRGGMCLVFEALHVDLQKRVAIKLLRPEHARNKTTVARFVREGRAAARVRHRNAVDVVDVAEQNGIVFLVMEHLEGEDLSRKLKREGHLSATETCDTLIPVMAAVNVAHTQNVVHRDLKPGNLFLSRSPEHDSVEPKVLDFGISKLRDEEDDQALTGTDTTVGTAYYIAPELIGDSKNALPSSDQYALGVILYQCLTGSLPYRGHNPMETLGLILRGVYERPRVLRPEIPEALEQVVMRALSAQPADRFPSVAALAAAMIPFASAGITDQWSRVFQTTPATISVEAPPPLPIASTNGTLSDTNHSLPVVEVPATRPRLWLLGLLGLFSLAATWTVLSLLKHPRPSHQIAVVSTPVTVSHNVQNIVDASVTVLASPVRVDSVVPVIGASEPRLRTQAVVARHRTLPDAATVVRPTITVPNEPVVPRIEHNGTGGMIIQ